MDLKIIEYGSLASSEIMNNNFSYLDEKIETNSEATNTTVSSLLSNIATINTRLNDLVETFEDSIESLNSNLEEYRQKTKILVSENSMIPNWAGCISIPDLSSYEILSNGYLLLILENTTSSSISINGVNVILNPNVTYIPVKKGDSIISNIEKLKAYYVPTTSISIENF